MSAEKFSRIPPTALLILSALALAPLTGCSVAGSSEAASPPVNVDMLTAAPPPPPPTDEPRDGAPFELNTLLRHAALHSPDMLEQEHNIARNDPFRFRGWRQYMPFINAGYQLGYFQLLKGDTQGSSDEIGGSYTLSANYPVYHWGALDAEKQAAFLREARARDEAALAWRHLSGSIRQQYHGAVLLKATVATQEKQLAWAKKRQDHLTAIHQAGRMDDTERLSRSIEIKDFELSLQRAKIELANELAKLRDSTGLHTLALGDLPDAIPVPPIDLLRMARQLEAFQHLDAHAGEETKISRLYREELEHYITQNKARMLPTFNLGASVSQSPYQPSTGGFEMQTILFAGITGNWNLFDRDITNTTVRQLKAEQRLVDARLKSSQANRLLNLRNLLEQIRVSQEMLALRRAYLESAETGFAAARENFVLGRIDQLALDQSEEQLLKLRRDILADQVNIANAYYQFQAGIGQDPAAVLYTPPSNEN